MILDIRAFWLSASVFQGWNILEFSSISKVRGLILRTLPHCKCKLVLISSLPLICFMICYNSFCELKNYHILRSIDVFSESPFVFTLPWAYYFLLRRVVFFLTHLWITHEIPGKNPFLLCLLYLKGPKISFFPLLWGLI